MEPNWVGGSCTWRAGPICKRPLLVSSNPKGRVLMELKMDEGLKALIESGKGKGYLTYSQVNDYLPDDAVNPEKLDQLLMILEDQGIELIDESEAEEREAGPATATETESRGELDL